MKGTKKKGPKLDVTMPVPTSPQRSPADLDDKVKMVLGGVEYVVKAQDLVRLKELGRGAYGIVETMEHVPSKTVMAVKRIHATLNTEEEKRMLIELNASANSTNCPYMVLFYGAMYREGDVWICMEVMDTSLDKFYRICVDCQILIPELVLARIAYSLVMALDYMKQTMNLMHRDVKPSNILINRKGEVKICDFGISGRLTDSVAKTMQAGCKPYMAPERVDPAGEAKSAYDVRSDVWSLGITMIEIATGMHPYSKWKTPFEQLKQVVLNPPPVLQLNENISPELVDFVRVCLIKNYKDRPKYAQLLNHPFVVKGSQVPPSQVAQFVNLVLEKNSANQNLLASCSLSGLNIGSDETTPESNSASSTLLVPPVGASGADVPLNGVTHSDSSSVVSGSSSADSEKIHNFPLRLAGKTSS